MNHYGHLKSYELKLVTRSPVFIGSGKEYTKKDYYNDWKNKKVHFINISKMFSLIAMNGLVDEYERYYLNRPFNDLYSFFKNCKFSKIEIDSITEYTANVGDALVEGKALSAIQQFMRSSNNKAYIPGSSLKGYLRTAILWKMIRLDKKSIKDSESLKEIEKKYLYTLTLNKKKPYDEVNCIMRAISISDSEFIDNDRMILTKKVDISKDGHKNTINTIREAIAPGTTLRFRLTIDESISTRLNASFIKEAIREYGEYYQQTFVKMFNLPRDGVHVNMEDCIVLGGGSGYFGKNIMYPLYGKELAVKKVSSIMMNEFKDHHHERDITVGISPRMLKHTSYQSKSYPYGICKITIL